MRERSLADEHRSLPDSTSPSAAVAAARLAALALQTRPIQV